MRRWSVAVVTTLVVIVIIAWRWSGAPAAPAAPGTAAATSDGAVLYRCTMPECGDAGSTDPSSRCPVCGMKRERVVGGAGAGGVLEVALSPRAIALAEVATEPLTRGPLYRSVRAFGVVEVDERRVTRVNARLAGTVERLAADQTGMRLESGDALLEIYSLDLLEAQNELLRLEWGFGRIEGRGRNRSVAQDLVTARHRLQLLGMTADEIDAMVEEDHENPYLVVRSPIDGTIVRKEIFAGQYVRAGDLLFEIVDLSALWLQLACYEDDLAWIGLGQQVVATTRSLPGEDLRGKVSFVDPVVDVATRTARVRVELPNSRGRLKPGMYATAWIRSELSSPDPAGHLRLPREAVLEAGGRALVYVEVAKGVFRGRDVRLGPAAEDESGRASFPVVAGLEGDERVVTRGGFAIDSQAQIEGRPSLFAAASEGRERPLDDGAGGHALHHEDDAHAPAGTGAPRPAGLEPRVEVVDPANPYCPVHPNQPVDPTIYLIHRGVRVHLCTHRCPRLFLANPDRYIPNLPPELQREMTGGAADGGTTPDG